MRVTELVLGFKCPLRLSLVSTLLVVPPLAPLAIVRVSVLAIILISVIVLFLVTFLPKRSVAVKVTVISPLGTMHKLAGAV